MVSYFFNKGSSLLSRECVDYNSVTREAEKQILKEFLRCFFHVPHGHFSHSPTIGNVAKIHAVRLWCFLALEGSFLLILASSVSPNGGMRHLAKEE